MTTETKVALAVRLFVDGVQVTSNGTIREWGTSEEAIQADTVSFYQEQGYLVDQTELATLETWPGVPERTLIIRCSTKK